MRNRLIAGYFSMGSPMQGAPLADPKYYKSKVPWFVIGLAVSAMSVGNMTMWTALWASAGRAQDQVTPSKGEDGVEKAVAASLGIESNPFYSSMTRLARSRSDWRGKSEENIVREEGLPLLDAVFGSSFGPPGTRATSFLDAMTDPNPNSVKDLNPGGGFIQTLNDPANTAKETNFKRAVIVSQNGNIYESAIWEQVSPIRNFYVRLQQTYWVKACRQWWAFPYWAALAAQWIPIGAIDGIPNSWANLVAGGGYSGLTKSDGFVPHQAEYWTDTGLFGPGLGRAYILTQKPGNIGTGNDIVRTCPNFSHVDLNSSYDEIPNHKGRSGVSRLVARKELVNALRECLRKFEVTLQ